MRSYTPSEMETVQVHGLLLSAVAPRPIAFVSTLNQQGVPNLAPFSFFNVFSADPPVAIFSPARRVRDNTTKHTLDNVEQSGECVINMVNYAMMHQMNLASSEYADGVNEFEKAGLTAIASECVKPFRVQESPVQLECTVREVIHLGKSGGAGNLVVTEIVRMHFQDDVFGIDGNPDPHKLDLVARMGQNWYCRASGDAIFEVPKPGRDLGIGIDAIPDRIRYSRILSGNDLGKLGMQHELPTAEQVRAFAQQPDILEWIGMLPAERVQREQMIHEQAKRLLEQGDIENAWKLLLTPDHV